MDIIKSGANDKVFLEQFFNSFDTCTLFENAIAESFFHTLKTKLIHHEIFHIKEQVKRSIFEYIKVFYNRESSYSSINNLSSVAFEEKEKLLQKKITLRDYIF